MSVLTGEIAKDKFETKYPDWELTYFTNGLGRCTVRHKCGKEKDYAAFNSVQCLGPTCDACKPKKDIVWRYNVGDVIKDENRDITIIDRKVEEKIEDEKTIRKKYYKYRCNVCGYDCGPSYLKGEFIEDRWIIESSLVVGIGCTACGHRAVVPGINDIATLAPERVKFFKNPEDAKRFSPSSHNEVEVKCPLCGREKNTFVQLIDDGGFGCICGDGFSYPEKFMYSLLEQVKVDFIYQLTKTTFEWCGNKRYDFYLIDKNIIIETHGPQHYDDFGFYDNKRRTFEEEQENDRIKKELAFQNGFDESNYIVLDCRKSETDFIKNSIKDTNLLEILGVKEDDITWQECHKFAASNFIKKICDFWESYKKEPKQLIETKMVAERFHISKTCALDSLKKGRELGWCVFLTRHEQSQKISDEIIKLYNSGMNTTEILNTLKVDRHKVIDSLTAGDKKGLCSYNGKQSLIEANLGINSPVGQPVYCIDLDIMFPTRTEGERFIKHKLDYALNHLGKKCGGYEWRRATKQEYIEWCKTHNL